MAGPLAVRVVLACLFAALATVATAASEPAPLHVRPAVALVDPAPPYARLSPGLPLAGETYTERKTGVRFPRRMVPPGSDVEQRIAGAGVRTKFFFKVYAVALHVEPLPAWDTLVDWRERGASTLEDSDDFFDDLLDTALPKTLTLVMVRDVDADDMREAFEDALAPRVRKARVKAERSAGLAALETFEGWFDREYVQGTEMVLAAQPGGRLTATVDGRSKGTLVSTALVRALFDVYLGEDPISEDARDAFGRGMVKVFDAGEELAEQRAAEEAESHADPTGEAVAEPDAAAGDADDDAATDDAADETGDTDTEGGRAATQLDLAAAQLDSVSDRQGEVLLELLIETSGLLRAMEALGDPLAEQARALHESMRAFAHSDGLLGWLADDAELQPPPCLCAFDAQAGWEALRAWLQLVQQRLLDHARAGETAT